VGLSAIQAGENDMEILIAGGLGVIIGMILDNLILRNHYSSKARELEGEVSILKHDLKEQKSLTSDAEARWATEREKASMHSAEMHSLTTHGEALKGEVAETKSHLAVATATIATLEGKVSSFEAANAEKGDTSAALAALDEKLAGLEAANAKLQASLEQCESDRELAANAFADVEELRTQVAHVSGDPQDLQRIEGIGPKIAGVLNDAGIVNYAQLAEQSGAALRAILDEAGIGRIAKPATWPRQAALAAAEDWDALDALQDALHGGRDVE
jgi:predicted flap endonuclease-1-like 5' DNA nuclease